MPGGVFGLTALCMAGGIISPTTARLLRLGRAIEAGGTTPTPEQAAQAAALPHHLAQSARLTAALLAVVLLAMATARYI